MSAIGDRFSIVFTGSSSGGHLLPGLAVAEEIVASRPDIDVQFVTAGREVEDQIFQAFPAVGRRRLYVPPLKSFFRNPVRMATQLKQSLSESRRVIQEQRPSVVVGLGGLQAVPIVRAARMKRIPVVLMEQNVIPGKATQFAARYATRICLSFDETRKHFSRNDRCVTTGNPLRRTLVDNLRVESNGTNDSETSENTLLILGGSQGAAAVNEAVMSLIQSNEEALNGWKVIHQTGQSQAELVRDHYSRLGINAEVAAYFDNMAELYRLSTIVVCRAGATTLAELALAGKPAIVVPYPRSARDHQLLNARWYAGRHAVKIAEQSTIEITKERIWAELEPLLDASSLRSNLATNIRRTAQPDAAGLVRDEILNLI